MYTLFGARSVQTAGDAVTSEPDVATGTGAEVAAGVKEATGEEVGCAVGEGVTAGTAVTSVVGDAEGEGVSSAAGDGDTTVVGLGVEEGRDNGVPVSGCPLHD